MTKKLCVAFSTLALLAAAANAQGLQAALSGFTSDSYSDIEDAINAVAASGDVLVYARALAELESMRPAHYKAALSANDG